MKRSARPPRRQVFVLTPDEKRAAACVIGAFLLGLGTMYYRARHPRAAPPPKEEQRDAKRGVGRARAAHASPATLRTPPVADREDPAPDAED